MPPGFFVSSVLVYLSFTVQTFSQIFICAWASWISNTY